MGNKFVYVSCPGGGLESIEEMSFFDSPEAAWLDYQATTESVGQLSRHEFIEAIEDTEMIEEDGYCWYRDTLISLEKT